ncbi:MAG TPA: c-type cytochrome [Terriglobales bacterium]|nr:c-type cytochrome [Terriglobales bacterium]
MKAHASTGPVCSIGALVLGVFLSSIAFATGRTGNLYQAKCSQCHGKNGEGKPSIKAPSLVSSGAKKMSDNELRGFIVARANGEIERNPSHTFLKKRLTKDQVEQIITDIRKMQESHP